MPSLSAAQLNNEIVSLRKTVEAAKRFTIERLTRRTVPGNKKKDVRIERFKKEIEYIKKGLKTDEVTKFALVNTKSIDNLGITKTTPPSQSALYKVATATVLVEAIDKIRAKYPQWGKEIPFHLQRLGKTSLDAKLKKKDQKSKPASLKPSALVDDDEAEDAESDEAGSDVEMEEVDTDAEDEEEAEDVDEDIEADEDASPVKTNGAAKDNRLITTSDEDSDEDESFKVNKSGKITLADILRSKVAKLMSEDDEGFDGAEDFEDLDGLRHLIATAEDSDAEEELESESDEAMEVTPPKPVISTKKAGKLPPSKAAASTPDKYKTQHKEMIEAAKAIGAKKNSAKQAAKNGSKQPVVQPKGKQEPKNVQKTPADDKKQQKKKVTTPNVNVHEGKKYPSTPVPKTKSVAKKISLQAQESDDDDDSDEQVPVIKPQSKKRPVSKQQDSDEDESDDETSFVTPTAKKLKNAQGKAVAQKKQKPELSFDVGDDEEENDSEEEEKPKKSPGTKKEPKSRGFFKHQPPSVQNEREQQRHQRGNDEEGGGRRSFGGGNRGFSPRGDFRGGRGFGNRGGDRGGRGFGRGGGFGGGRGRGFNRDGDRGGRGFSRDGDRGGRGFSRGGSPGRGFGRGGGGFGGRGRGGDNDFRGGRGRGFGGGRGRGGEGGRGRGGFGGGGGGNHPSWEAKRQQRSQEQGAFAARGRGQRVTFDD